ncbi:hypothetical protein MSAN_00344300 [Mycena sanguinolenta]|uniref:Uncharacterized protein n=1 Tax=Mycena sanguinolenta TaxID=230812 RepID=A0A8H6ZBJ5_9AGAR|nr:hypothetical protein MSAN_00344300 [Mycena sanguinolenta]
MFGKSSGFRAARNALQAALVILGKIPIPGIEAVTETLSQALTKVQEVRDNVAEWANLSDRVQTITFLVSGNSDYDMSLVLGERLLRVLQDITESVDASKKSGYFRRFLNSTEDASSLTKHILTLNNLIGDLTLEVGLKTNRTIAQLQQELEKFKSNLVVRPDERTKKSGFFRISSAPVTQIVIFNISTGGEGGIPVQSQIETTGNRTTPVYGRS